MSSRSFPQQRLAERKGEVADAGQPASARPPGSKTSTLPPPCSSISRRAISPWPTGQATPSARPRGRKAATFRVPRRPGQVTAAGERVLAGALRPRHREFGSLTQPTATRPSFRLDHAVVPAVLRMVQDATRCHQRPSGKPICAAPMACFGQEMIGALTHLQHARGKNVVFVAIPTNVSMTTTARCSCRRSKAAKPVWSCPASSMRS